MFLLDWFAGAPTPALVGERITLRAPRASDYEQWRALRAASRSFLVPWEPAWGAEELSRASFDARLSRYRQDARARHGHAFFLFETDSQRLCGGITLGNIRRGVAQMGTLGYWMGERFAGRGLMAEAVRSVSTYAFEVERLHRLEAACLPHNRRSIGLLQKCGFAQEGHLRKYLMIAGTWHDHLLFSRLAEDGPVPRVRTEAVPALPGKVDPVPHA